MDLTGRPLLPLPGTGNGNRGVAVSAGIVCAVLLSRLLFFPDGPWEQDEALFATGVFDFDPVRHRPHPPGFPGWILIGKAFSLLTGDPLDGLRAASSIASTMLFAMVASLLARITRPRIALASATAFTFAPLVWVHAPRAFSTTPALCLIVGSLYCWCRRSTWRTSLLGWGLLGAAATVRPQLAPSLALITVVGLWHDRDHRKRLASGIAVAVLVVAAAYGYAAVASGGIDAYWLATRSHFATHSANATRTVAWQELGIVRGFVRPSVALVVAGFTVAGGVLATRSDRKLGAWLLALLAVTAAMVLGKHHPGFPRYAVAIVLAAAPLIAIACDRLPPRIGEAVLFAGALAGCLGSLPTLFAMRDHPLPPVAAMRAAARFHPTALGFSHGNFSFVRLAHKDGTFPAPIIDIQDVDRSGPLPHGAFALAGSSLRFLPGVTVCTTRFDGFPEAARALSQGRFDSTTIARAPILLGDGVHPPERDRDGAPFAWLSERATLWNPPGATTLAMSVVVPSARAGLRMEVRTSAAKSEASAAPHLEYRNLAAGHQLVRVSLADCEDGCRIDLSFPATARAEPTTAGHRQLSIQLLSAWPEGVDFSPTSQTWSPGIPASIRAAGVAVDGVWGPETFWDEQRGAWTGATFNAVFPAGPGTIAVKLARPEHASGPVTLSTDLETRKVEVGTAATIFTLRTGAQGGVGHLQIVSPTFVPRTVNPTSTDGRELGVVLFEVTYTPLADPCAPA